jgi:hypothetical protein
MEQQASYQVCPTSSSLTNKHTLWARRSALGIQMLSLPRSSHSECRSALPTAMLFQSLAPCGTKPMVVHVKVFQSLPCSHDRPLTNVVHATPRSGQHHRVPQSMSIGLAGVHGAVAGTPGHVPRGTPRVGTESQWRYSDPQAQSGPNRFSNSGLGSSRGTSGAGTNGMGTTSYQSFNAPSVGTRGETETVPYNSMTYSSLVEPKPEQMRHHKSPDSPRA